MTDIRTRIATAIMQTCHGVYMDDAVNAADAVIRELGLIDGDALTEFVSDIQTAFDIGTTDA